MIDTKVLVVDDEFEILQNLERLLASEGYQVTTLQDPSCYRDVLSEVGPDVVITDLRMPKADGMTLLAVTIADDPSLPVILITGFGTISSAVEAMQEGAFDYLAKPFSAEQLFVAVERAAQHRRLLLENQELREQVEVPSGGRVIGSSEAFTKVLDRVARVAPTDANVLITGESGTGKEVVARLIHDQSRRADGPFMPIDCAALPEGLLESELFGHQKGAFTGAVARRKGLFLEGDGGTLFLDEIGELSIPLQSKLLRALEQRQVRPVGDTQLIDVDVRVLAATNMNLEAAVAEGVFREDLYYRLNVVELKLPPLRDRREDLPLLGGHFLREAARGAGRDLPKILPEAWRYRWPGNIRQLRNIMHRLVALSTGDPVRFADLPSEIREVGPRPLDGLSLPVPPLEYQAARDLAISAFMEQYLERLLDAHSGNVSGAARSAGVSRRTLHRWLAEYRVERAGRGAHAG